MRTTTIAITATLLLTTLVGCGTTAKPDETAPPAAPAPASSAPTAGTDDAPKKTGIPPKPDAVQREVILRALRAVNPAIATDEDKAISNARNQCSTITGGGNANETAKTRFSTSDHQVTDEEALAINTALKATLCT